MRSILSLLLLLGVPFSPAASSAGGDRSEELEALLERSDVAYARRDDPGALEEARTALEEAERTAPDDYEVEWRLARLDLWIADDPALPKEQKSQLGKEAWEHGDRAIRADPNRVEGWNYAAAGVGNYALGIGLFRALGEDLEGKFRERLSRAERIDADFQHGAIQTAWGRFWSRLPWPKYDARKSERALKEALEKNPDNVRAHVYLAELYAREGQQERARTELERALAHPPGQYDAPEERRMQTVARAELGPP